MSKKQNFFSPKKIRKLRKVKAVTGDRVCKHGNFHRKVDLYPIFTGGELVKFCRKCTKGPYLLKALTTKTIMAAKKNPYFGYFIPKYCSYSYSGSHFKENDLVLLSRMSNNKSVNKEFTYTLQKIINGPNAIDLKVGEEVIINASFMVLASSKPDEEIPAKIKIIKVILPDNHPFLAITDMGKAEDVSTYQLIISDINNKFPGDDGFISYDDISHLSLEDAVTLLNSENKEDED